MPAFRGREASLGIVGALGRQQQLVSMPAQGWECRDTNSSESPCLLGHQSLLEAEGSEKASVLGKNLPRTPTTPRNQREGLGRGRERPLCAHSKVTGRISRYPPHTGHSFRPSLSSLRKLNITPLGGAKVHGNGNRPPGFKTMVGPRGRGLKED